MKRLAAIVFYYPFTIPGTLLLAAALYLLGRGVAQNNAYALLLALLALAVLALLALAGRLQALAFSRRQPQWDSSAPLYARRPDQSQTIQSDGLRVLPFFRIHFLLRGRLQVGRRAHLRVLRQVSFASGRAHPLPLEFPLCGALSARGRFAVRDLFGLTRSRFGEDLPRSLTVHPAWQPALNTPLVEPSGGYEEKSRRRSAEEEKYFMREYIPGDRFRDINWKVSSRLQELITRISPVTQEKTRLLSVHFRAFRASEAETLESVLHLDFLKSWLLAFLRGLRKENDRLQFRVRAGAAAFLLATDEDIERFGWELAGLRYQADPGYEAEPSEGDLFVFSTPFDRGLSGFLAAHPRVRIHLFRTAKSSSREAEGQDLPLFPGELDASLLPGPWALRREAATAAPPPGPGADLEEQALAVRIFP